MSAVQYRCGTCDKPIKTGCYCSAKCAAADGETVSRETLSPTVRPLLFRNYLREANAQGLKDTTRRIVAASNSILPNAGDFSKLKLETARGAEHGTAIRAQYEFESGRVRVITVLPLIRPGDLFWAKDGRFGSRAKSSQTLEVLTVRVGRVQDMTEEDAEREGMTVARLPLKFRRGTARLRDVFANLWDDINGRGSWASNPWVWIYRYKVHAVNIDDLLASRGLHHVSKASPSKK